MQIWCITERRLSVTLKRKRSVEGGKVQKDDLYVYEEIFDSPALAFGTPSFAV